MMSQSPEISVKWSAQFSVDNNKRSRVNFINIYSQFCTQTLVSARNIKLGKMVTNLQTNQFSMNQEGNCILMIIKNYAVDRRHLQKQVSVAEAQARNSSVNIINLLSRNLAPGTRVNFGIYVNRDWVGALHPHVKYPLYSSRGLLCFITERGELCR